MASPNDIAKLQRIKPGRRGALIQILNMQQTLHKMTTAEGVKPMELASCARAWCELEERKRILRGKPLPGSLKPEKPKRNPKYDGSIVMMGE